MQQLLSWFIFFLSVFGDEIESQMLHKYKVIITNNINGCESIKLRHRAVLNALLMCIKNEILHHIHSIRCGLYCEIFAPFASKLTTTATRGCKIKRILRR